MSPVRTRDERRDLSSSIKSSFRPSIIDEIPVTSLSRTILESR
jgi:hypothetical protein